MGADDKERQRERYLRGSAREVQRRSNQLARRRRGADDDDPAARDRDRRRTEDWLDDGEADELSPFEKITHARRAAAAPPADVPVGPRFDGTVVARHRDACEVALARRAAVGDGRTVRVATRPQDPELAVGDCVDLAVDPRDGSFRLARRNPRRSVLERPDPADPRVRLLVAANVDVVVAVQAADRLRPGLVDRLAIAAARGGAALLVCVNKIDVLESAQAGDLELLRATAAEHRVPCIEVSARTGDGVGALRAALAGRCCAFVGASGVGKSSLCNALDPALDLRIGDVRATDRRGRHTTSTSSLHRLAGDVTLIDTPGVRAFGLGEVTREELDAAFPDVARAARGCRFRDCAHGDEPDCAVRDAVADGRLPAARAAAWRRVHAAAE